MKKLAILLAVLLLLTACAAPAEQIAATDAPLTEATAAQTEPPTEAQTENDASTAADASEEVNLPSESTSDFEIAKTFIEKSLDELKAAIGEPSEAYYEESCIGEGDDGILTYPNFTVYTFREADGSAETVVDVEWND